MFAEVKMWRENGNEEGVSKAAEAVRARLFDLSRFMQEFKHKFSIWFNKRHGRRGALWEERFKCSLVEGEGGSGPEGLGALQAVAAYIDLNSVRAGLVQDPKDYRWCSYAAAVAGDKAARAGLAKCAGEGGRRPDWRKVARRYRLVLFGAGEERVGGVTRDGAEKRRRASRNDRSRRLGNAVAGCRCTWHCAAGCVTLRTAWCWAARASWRGSRRGAEVGVVQGKTGG